MGCCESHAANHICESHAANHICESHTASHICAAFLYRSIFVRQAPSFFSRGSLISGSAAQPASCRVARRKPFCFGLEFSTSTLESAWEVPESSHEFAYKNSTSVVLQVTGRFSSTHLPRVVSGYQRCWLVQLKRE